jgi:predicted transcriptional regulator
MTPEQVQEMKEAQHQILSNRVENVLNDFVDSFGLNNDDLKKILQQVIVDIDRGFVGEPC